MRIAQVSPLYESVPPRYYGGTERVVAYLAEELVRQGHDVTLFASGDSVTSAPLVAPCMRALRLDAGCVDPVVHHVLMLDQVYREAGRFDVIHSHVDYLAFPLARRSSVPTLTTLHGRLDIDDRRPTYREFRDLPFVSISDAQRAPLPWLNWMRTVHHGLPEDLYTFREEPGGYLAFLGRISPEKGVPEAIEIARRLGMPLRIAAKVGEDDREYFEQTVRPLLRGGRIEFVGEIGEPEKNELLGNAFALLFPVQWPEPFGMVLAEAMACGTPIIAYPRGSVPEIVADGVNGFVVHNVEQAVEAVKNVPSIDRAACRRIFEERFTARRMTQDYLALYERLSRSTITEPAASLWGGI